MKLSRLVFLACAYGLMPASTALSAQLDWDVILRAGELYDSNVTFAEDDEIDDLITQLSAGLRLDHEGPTHLLRLEGNVKEEIFASESDLTNTGADAGAFWRLEMSAQDRLEIRNSFIYDDEPRSFEEAFGRNTGRFSYYRNRFFADYTREFSKQLSGILRYANEINDISRPGSSDSLFNRIGGDAEYALTSETVVLGGYDFSVRGFNPGNAVTTHSPNVGVRQYLTQQVFFEGRLGLDVIDPATTGDHITKPRVLASLNHQLDDQTLGALVFEHSYTTTAYDSSLFKQWRLSLNYQRELINRLTGDISAFYGESEYVARGIEDELAGLGLGFTYEITPYVKGNIAYRISNLASNTAGREYIKNTVFVGIAVEI